MLNNPVKTRPVFDREQLVADHGIKARSIRLRRFIEKEFPYPMWATVLPCFGGGDLKIISQILIDNSQVRSFIASLARFLRNTVEERIKCKPNLTLLAKIIKHHEKHRSILLKLLIFLVGRKDCGVHLLKDSSSFMVCALGDSGEFEKYLNLALDKMGLAPQ